MANAPGMKDTSSDSSFEIKIKILDLDTYSFHVNKNMSIPALKEEILIKIGIPMDLQRLLYKGKVLSNDQLLSEFNLKEGDTIHLVVRRTIPSQPTSSPVVADTSRTSSSQGVGAESSQNTSWIQSDYSANVQHILLGEALSSVSFAHLPSLHAEMSSLQAENEHVVTPNALTTISAFINRMESMLPSSSNSLNTGQHRIFWANATTEFLNTEGRQTPEFFSFILDRTEELLRDNAATALSHLSTLLQRRNSFYDPSLRGHTRLGAMHLARALQHLGAMLLELGRITNCLRIEQTSEESFVDAGQAVYISGTGPNPGMIQISPSPSPPSWIYNPVSFRRDPSDPRSSASQSFDSTTSTVDQCQEQTLQPPPPSGSESVPTLGAQSTASIPSSSNAMQSDATEDFHPYMKNGSFDVGYFLLDMSNDGASDDSKNMVGAEDSKQSGSGVNHDSDIAVSGKVGQQTDLGQVVERIEQNSDPRSIFGPLLEISVSLFGEQNVCQDIVELGNDEKLANEYMGVLTRDIRRRLAKECSFIL